MEQYKELFIEETYELLDNLENLLLELENDKDNKELINNIFRVMHTIKGSSGMFGFTEILKFTHSLENVFDNIRKGEIKMHKDLIDLTLKAKDQIRFMIESESSENTSYLTDKLISEFERYLPVNRLEDKEEDINKKEEKKDNEIFSYRIKFVPAKDIFLRGINPVMLLNELRSMGESVVLVHVSEIPDLENLNPEFCYMWWDIILTTKNDINTVKDIFIFVEESSELKVDIIDYGADVDYKRIGEVLIERGEISNEKLNEALSKKKYLGELLSESNLVNIEAVESALVEQDYLKKLKERRSQELRTSSIRVKSEKLDSLVNLVGELVSAQAQLNECVKEVSNSKLNVVSEVIERITSELRENAMNIRMMPIGTTFGKFARLVRDLSNDLGKNVVLLTEGAETELDKNVLEKLNDPLIHIIRNSIDHGIEMPEIRKKNKKPLPGTIKLSASHEGTNVVIRISDNGCGINRQDVREKAEKLGLLKKDEQITDSELYSLIFHPGFSTIKEVTEISGRGVGMDVVKKTIDNLSGSIIVESMEGEGTNISLKLPLTLAIIEGLLVKLGNQIFVIPLTNVEECLEYIQGEADKERDEDCVNIRNEYLPFLRLRKRFEIAGTSPYIQQIVVVRSGNERIGLLVDSVIGSNQTVIKPLSKIINNIDAISGATILGDGSVAFIIDINKITKIISRNNLI